ncbi:serine/threonine-protein kinase [Haliangium sp.]|uniref:serine/threonine-protein kinase n=1 Tax=Haliangium sp. TaxID=2663208 RepID=UPI003D0E048A
MKRGSIIASRFEILARLRARGGSQVFAGRDRVSGQSVAIKILEEGTYEAERFAREVTLLIEQRHPGIVRYIAHGTIGRRPYLVMEWVKGRTLAHFLSTGLTLRESVEVTRRVAEALASVHLRGVVHRDVQPSNIVFVDGQLDRVKLVDFGFARRVGQPGTTRTGTIIGTPGYLSPEQARGDWDVDARTDVFALGCVLYTCLCGHPPFTAQHLLATLISVVFQEPWPLEMFCPEAHEPLRSLVRRMLAKDRLARPVNAAVVAEDLADLVDLPDTPRRPHAPSASALFSNLAELSTAAPTRPAVPSAMPPFLTTGESDQPTPLFLLVALDREPVGPGEQPPESLRGMTAQTGGAIDIIQQHRGEAALLADGTLVAKFASGPEAPMAAARCALQIRALLPDAPIVLGEGGAPSPSTSLDALVQLLIEESFQGVLDDGDDPPRGPRVRLGSALAEHVTGDLMIERRGAGEYLLARGSV